MLKEKVMFAAMVEGFYTLWEFLEINIDPSELNACTSVEVVFKLEDNFEMDLHSAWLCLGYNNVVPWSIELFLYQCDHCDAGLHTYKEFVCKHGVTESEYYGLIETEF